MPYRYLLLYKPYDVLSQFTDESGRRTLKDLVAVPNVYAVGRLDRDSEGLLLLTDDGPMQHRLSHPRFGHRRQYWVQVECGPKSQPIEAAIDQLRAGVTIRGYRTRPAQVSVIPDPDLPPRNPPIRYRKQIATAWLEIALTEGKNRQVRRMTAAVGFPTLRLVRSALFLPTPEKRQKQRQTKKRAGAALALTLSGLSPGQWRSLTATEIRSLPGNVHSRA
ncbi:conserved hypothetical protein [Synechococcus sp. PCC 7335]|uniref:pseudouridine synthase n=1 Tax=Synechococcus sp. (strain ATCC 29403 / PCC 7335) TaxID=91464 RepID=UPI00017ECB29|nr:pseudouridine synthase [Synechococcus sp. PCC 7335]EDX86024.1 conserved hypothetical protein [Synechococcus sp. PCC 7335]